MRIDVLTLFPDIFAPVQASIPERARQAGLWELFLHCLRDWGVGKHRQVDDTPYGGGPGMVMACGPLYAAVEEIQSQSEARAHVIYMTPQGRPLSQERVLELATIPRLLILCGHYEGVDERVVEGLVDEEVCIGDFVVSGGELPAMMLIDAVVRVLPGALREASVQQDSFYAGLLDHPHYTRPPEFRGMRVPDVLLSGNHAQIDAWRQAMALERTRFRRPDLYARYEEATSSAGNRPPEKHKGVSHGQEVQPSRASRQEESCEAKQRHGGKEEELG